MHPTVEASGYLRSVEVPRGDDAHQTVSGRALPLARPLQTRPSSLPAPAPAPPAAPEAVEAPKVSPCLVQPRPQESFAANSMCAGEISTQVRTLIGEQLKVLEDRLKTEILPKAVPAGAKVPLAELPTAGVTARAERLEEKLLQQFQRLKQEGERLKSNPKQSGDDPPLAPAEREGDPFQRDEGVKELTIGFRRLAEELQMQMGRVERRLEDLEEDVRSLKVQVKEKEEQPRLSSCVTSVITLEKRMDGMQEMMRSLEDGLRSWQSRTQQLDRWHQDHRSCTVTAPVTAPVTGATAGAAAADATETETTETSVALGSSPARPLSPRMNEVKVTEHRDGDSPRHLRPPGASCGSNGTATTVSYSKFMSLPPAYSPSDKDAMSDGDTRDFLELSAEVGLSLAVPQLGPMIVVEVMLPRLPAVDPTIGRLSSILTPAPMKPVERARDLGSWG